MTSIFRRELVHRIRLARNALPDGFATEHRSAKISAYPPYHRTIVFLQVVFFTGFD